MKIQTKTTIALILAIALITLSQASVVYPGSTINYVPSNVGLDVFTNISFQDNTSIVLYEFTNTSINITIPTDYNPSNFTIIFSGYKNEVVESHSFSYGWGSREIPKIVNNSTNTSNTSVSNTSSSENNRTDTSAITTVPINKKGLKTGEILALVLLGIALFLILYLLSKKKD